MKECWRLLANDTFSGEFNMALDEALLLCMNSHGGKPVLRFYGWSPTALSLGKYQKLDGINFNYLSEQTIDLVRRPTGGRAILHDNELTYAVIVPSTSLLYGSLAQIYNNVSSVIMAGLSTIGAQFDQPQNSTGTSMEQHFNTNSDACFGTRMGYELLCGGVKITAGAQRRMRHASLQHGSIPLVMDKDRYLDCFLWREVSARKSAEGLIGSLQDSLGWTVTSIDVSIALIEAFERINKIEFEESMPSSIELEIAAEIIKRKQGEWPCINTSG
ncbi:MAG TPA: lipoate--protein ligase family protein [Nitrospinota bacterium]|jgi:lipoate-protein ligase A|nr:lipoate--protein ligase family protein [Nitrospinota bacterium]|tara:strand:+ start:18188 stop:19006 length:819 start_codon:yes stop_codon:yes gene_type:complete